MKKVCWLSIFVFSHLVLSAQYEQILKDPNVIWAAEIEMTYDFSPFNTADSLHHNQVIYRKNYDPKNRIPYEGGELLMENLIDAARSGKWPAWTSGNTPRQLTSDELYWHDTVVTFDPVTYEETIKTVKKDYEISAFTAIRARQLLYFDEKKGDFGLITSAVAPLMYQTEWSQDGKSYDQDFIPFWLRMPIHSGSKAEKSVDINSKYVLWAAQIKTLANSPALGKQQTFKNIKPPVMKVLLDRFLTDKDYKAENIFDEPVDFKSRTAMISSLDTVITFNPETYEESTKIVKKELSAEDLPRLRMIQNWYWDDKKQRLIIELERFAPLSPRLDPEGNFLFDVPLFYRRVK